MRKYGFVTDFCVCNVQAQHQLQPTQQEDLDLPDDMELDGGPGDQEGHEEGPEDGLDAEAETEEGKGEPGDHSQQPFPEQSVTEGPEPELAAGMPFNPHISQVPNPLLVLPILYWYKSDLFQISSPNQYENVQRF